MEWMVLPLKRYADFSGRSRRREYWMFMLGYGLVFLILVLLSTIFGAFDYSDPGELGMPGRVITVLMVLLVLALFIPMLAVEVRRFHDQDMSGWFVLLFFIPYVGSLIILIFMCLEGTRGPNRFGPDPTDVADPQVFE